MNLLSLDQRRTSCIVSWSVDAPNMGAISETVVSSANFHIEERVLLVVRTLISELSFNQTLWEGNTMGLQKLASSVVVSLSETGEAK